MIEVASRLKAGAAITRSDFGQAQAEFGIDSGRRAGLHRPNAPRDARATQVRKKDRLTKTPLRRAGITLQNVSLRQLSRMLHIIDDAGHAPHVHAAREYSWGRFMVALSQPLSPEKAERKFFVGMALFIATTIVVGFGQWSLRGMVVRPVPILVHLHGLMFLSWLGVFIAQTMLIQRNAVARHKMLGRLAAGLAVLMLMVGAVTAIESVRLDRVPPFFTPSLFLALSFLELATFATLLTAAIVLRRQSDWHRRLVLGATIAIIGPAWGRILPMPLLGAVGGPCIMIIQLLYLSIAVIFDARIRGKFHPAYAWAGLAIVVVGVATPLLGATPPFLALAAALAPH